MKIKTEGSAPGREHPGDREVGTVTYTPYKDGNCTISFVTHPDLRYGNRYTFTCIELRGDRRCS